MIVLEGPDNAGKSTLALELSKFYGLNIIHPGGPPADAGERLLRLSEQYQVALQLNVIYDRITAISDQVYKLSIGRDAVMNEFLDNMVQYGKVKIIICLPPDHLLMQIHNHKPKAHETQQHVDYVIQNHKRIVAGYKYLIGVLPCFVYDYTKHGINDVIQWIGDIHEI